jgi:hypothetical protein
MGAAAGPEKPLPQAAALALLWAIFLAEGACRASVPFGWLPLRDAWKAGRVSFTLVMNQVRREIALEWRRYQRAKGEGKWQGDFILWMARIGYNANPKEWDAWEKNVRAFMKALVGSDTLE